MATLKVTTGPAAGRSLEVRGKVVIGRADGDLVIDDSELSRAHAAVTAIDGGVVVEDLGSTNGTFLDDTLLTGPRTLRSPGTIRLGATQIAVELTARDDATRTSAQPVVTETAPPATTRPRRPGGGSAVPVAVLSVVAAIVAIFVLAQDWKQTTEHRTDQVMRTTILRQQGAGVLIGADVNGPPLGPGSALINQTFHLKRGERPLQTGIPTRYSGELVSQFPDGTITASLVGTVTMQPNGSTINRGAAKIDSGTGKYENASGTLKQTGGRPVGSSLAVFRFTGTIKY